MIFKIFSLFSLSNTDHFLHLYLSKNPNSNLYLLPFKHDKIKYSHLHSLRIGTNSCLYSLIRLMELCTSMYVFNAICIILLNQVVNYLNYGCFWFIESFSVLYIASLVLKSWVWLIFCFFWRFNCCSVIGRNGLLCWYWVFDLMWVMDCLDDEIWVG